MTHFARSLLTAMVAGFWCLAPGPSASAQEAAALGIAEVEVQVDGLSCPFCAFGLKVKLARIRNVAGVEIRPSEGRVLIKPVGGRSVAFAELERAVREGGFTPRALRVTARGRLTTRAGAPGLELPDGTVLLLLREDETTDLLIAAVSPGATVSVEGLVERIPAGHGSHPPTLRVTFFKPVS
jgi:hypothetical protein